LEGNERTEIPHAVVHKLLELCNVHNINPKQTPDRLTYQVVRGFLGSSGYSGRFENIPKIIGLLTGISPKAFAVNQKQQLYDIFEEIQEPFQLYKGKRKNLLSYSYITYKFCELLGYTQFLPLLQLLATRNLMEADSIWEKICCDLKYQYIPTT
jgi:hypothetical protein